MSAAAQRVVDHLLAVAQWTYSRSSGPGGQRRDHVETRAELTITGDDLAGLPAHAAERLHAAFGLDRRPLRLRCGTERSRETNRAIVETRLRARVEAALAPPSPARRPTRPSRAARERRLEAKRLQTARKRGRGRVDPSAD